MTAATKSLIQQALKLKPEQKLELVESVWDSLREDELPPITASQKKELDRRLAAYEADPSSATDWDQAQREVDVELARRRTSRSKRRK